MEEPIFQDKNFIIMIDGFIANIKEILGDNLLSVIISGSVALGDYIYGKGDIDFFVVTKADLTIKDSEEIFRLHDRLREGELGLFGIQLEGVYCPLLMLQEPRNYVGLGCYIGTNRKGWKQISKSILSSIDYFTMGQYSKTVYGKDITKEIFMPSHDKLREEIITEIKNSLMYLDEITDVYFSLHLLYFSTRSLYTFLNYNILSKGKSCIWFVQNFPNSPWVPFVKYTSQYRYPLDEIEREEIDQKYIIENAPLFLEYVYSMIRDRNNTVDIAGK